MVYNLGENLEAPKDLPILTDMVLRSQEVDMGQAIFVLQQPLQHVQLLEQHDEHLEPNVEMRSFYYQ